MHQAALANVLHLLTPCVHKQMKDGLGTLVNASVNVLSKPAMI